MEEKRLIDGREEINRWKGFSSGLYHFSCV
jgi:hypothetical protein